MPKRNSASSLGLLSAIQLYPGRTLVLCALVLVSLGWLQDGLNLDSTTYAVIARNMAEQGSWFAPSYTTWYHPHFAEHPPLVMWLQGLIFLFLGATDATARLVGQLTFVGSIWLVFSIGCRLRGRQFGFLAGLILLLTYSFVQSCNATLLDGPMTFFGLLSIYGLVRILDRDDSTASLLLTGLGLAGAFLAKGVVAAPFWLSAILVLTIFRRDLFRKPLFWLLPISAVLPIDLFFLTDQLFAGGRFIDHYFMSQVLQRYVYSDEHIKTAWWEFSFRLLKLGLPASALFLFGVYYSAIQRCRQIWPIILTLLLFWLLYSGSAKLYHHYFLPAYPLMAILAGFPLVTWLSERTVRAVSVVFPILWLTTAVVVTAAGVRIHPIRSPEIYSLTQPMKALLERLPTRNGLMLGEDEPNWDYLAKAAWYWKSDLRKVNSAAIADSLMQAENSAWFVLAPRGSFVSDFELAQFGWKTYTANDQIQIYVRGITKSPGELSLGK